MPIKNCGNFVIDNDFTFSLIRMLYYTRCYNSINFNTKARTKGSLGLLINDQSKISLVYYLDLIF